MSHGNSKNLWLAIFLVSFTLIYTEKKTKKLQNKHEFCAKFFSFSYLISRPGSQKLLWTYKKRQTTQDKRGDWCKKRARQYIAGAVVFYLSIYQNKSRREGSCPTRLSGGDSLARSIIVFFILFSSSQLSKVE